MKKRISEEEKAERLRETAQRIADVSGEVAFVIGNDLSKPVKAVPHTYKLKPHQKIFWIFWPDGWRYTDNRIVKDKADLVATLWLPELHTLKLDEFIYPEYFWPEFEDSFKPCGWDAETGHAIEWEPTQAVVKIDLVKAGPALAAVEYKIFWSGILEQEYNRERIGSYILRQFESQIYHREATQYRHWNGRTNWKVKGTTQASFESVDVAQAKIIRKEV